MLQNGYLSPGYAEAFKYCGEVIKAPSGAFFLIRDIPGTEYKDACNLYPMFMPPINNKVYKEEDLKALGKLGLVSLTLVSSPINFSTVDHIWDEVKEYKTHYLINNSKELSFSSNHKRNIKKFKGTVELELNPEWMVSKFVGFYNNLIKRHDVIGFANFNYDQLWKMISCPGALMFTAKVSGQAVGIMVFYLIGNTAYYHLAAYSEEGYKNNASFPLMGEAISFFKRLGCDYLLLGAGAGIVSSSEGLQRFKAGWANEERKNFILFKVLDKQKYDILSKGKEESTFLPKYRG